MRSKFAAYKYMFAANSFSIWLNIVYVMVNIVKATAATVPCLRCRIYKSQSANSPQIP
jgi:hypothetical protein